MNNQIFWDAKVHVILQDSVYGNKNLLHCTATPLKKNENVSLHIRALRADLAPRYGLLVWAIRDN